MNRYGSIVTLRRFYVAWKDYKEYKIEDILISLQPKSEHRNYSTTTTTRISAPCGKNATERIPPSLQINIKHSTYVVREKMEEFPNLRRY